MESLIVQFSMGGYPALDERTRVVLRNAEDFKPLPPKRAERLGAAQCRGRFVLLHKFKNRRYSSLKTG